MKNMTNTGKMILAGLILAKAGKLKEASSILAKANMNDRAAYDDFVGGIKHSVSLFAKNEMGDMEEETDEDIEETSDDEVLPGEDVENAVSDAIDELGVDEETARMLSSVEY